MGDHQTRGLVEYEVSQVLSFYMTLLPSDSGEDIYNGAVEAVTTLTGALTVLTVGFVQINWKRFGDFGIIGVAFIGGILLITMSLANNIWFAYFGYILFRMSYQVSRTGQVTIQSSASDLKPDDDDGVLL